MPPNRVRTNMHIIIRRAAFADYLQARRCGDGYACIRDPLCSAETATKFEGPARERERALFNCVGVAR